MPSSHPTQFCFSLAPGRRIARLLKLGKCNYIDMRYQVVSRGREVVLIEVTGQVVDQLRGRRATHAQQAKV